MNVTFMIGNGFDLNLGLKTSYRDFYSWYLDEVQSNNDIESVKKLKKEILDNHNNWSDFELEFGRYSNKVDGNEEYRECLENILDKLTEYLKTQNEVFTLFNNYDYDIESMLLNFSKGVSIDAISASNEMIINKINIINFNYTNTVETLFNSSMNSVIQSSHLNIHGTLANDDIIFGVSDESQISNSIIFEGEKSFLVDFIKPESIEYSDSFKLKKSQDMISESDIIYIYGMSLGETDKHWFYKVVESLIENPELNLIIDLYSPQPKYSRLKGERKKLVDNCRDKLLIYVPAMFDVNSMRSLDSENYKNYLMHYENINNRIHIIVNQNIFEPLKDMCAKEEIMN